MRSLKLSVFTTIFCVTISMVAYGASTSVILGGIECPQDNYKNFHVSPEQIRDPAILCAMVEEVQESHSGLSIFFHQPAGDSIWGAHLDKLGFELYGALQKTKEILWVFRNGRGIPDFTWTGHSALTFIHCRSTNRFLVVKEKTFNFWTIPGGSVDIGEFPAAAAVREAKEEAGIDVGDPSKLRLMCLLTQVIDRKNLGVKTNDLAEIFFVEVDRESGSADGTETTDVRWVTLEELGSEAGHEGAKFNSLIAKFKTAMRTQPRGSYIADPGNPARQINVLATFADLGIK